VGATGTAVNNLGGNTFNVGASAVIVIDGNTSVIKLP
jgi:hypothetical protein